MESCYHQGNVHLFLDRCCHCKALGTANGQFRDAGGIGVDALGHIYVVDSGNNRIEKFDSNGTFITAWGSPGTSNGLFSEVTGVTVGLAGHVYVSDYGNNNVQVFGPSTNHHPTN